MEDVTKIPNGLYCYDEKGKCPYWSLREDLPKQENGYCSFLGKSDWDLNEERGPMEWHDRTGKVVNVTKPHEIPNSLIWDEVKECGENMECNHEGFGDATDEENNCCGGCGEEIK